MNDVIPLFRQDSNCTEDEKTQNYWDKQYKIRDKLIKKFKVIPIESRLIKDAKLVTFERMEDIQEYEELECGRQNCYNSWESCKTKFINFPCQIFVKYTKTYLDYYVAEYLTMEEFQEELFKLAQIS